MKPKSYTESDIFYSTRLSFEIDFYTSKSDIFLNEDFSVILNEYIFTVDKLDKSCLIKEYSAEKSKYILKISEGNYNYRIQQMEKILEYLNQYAYADFSSVIKTTLSYNYRTLNTIYEIKDINMSNYILNFNESKLFSMYENNNPKFLSFESLKRSNNLSITNNNFNNLYESNNTKLFNIDFSNTPYNYITFNYISGKNIFDSFKNFNETLNYYILNTYNYINEGNLSINDKMLLDINAQNNFMTETNNSISKFVEN
ncbi:MAG: hypothetical protein RSF67_09300, partial [Clostridia bacterium]